MTKKGKVVQGATVAKEGRVQAIKNRIQEQGIMEAHKKAVAAKKFAVVQEPTQVKQEHSKKGWSFNTAGPQYVNPYEIASGLTRKNPVAVVTFVQKEKKGASGVIIVLHNSINIKHHIVSGGYSIEEALLVYLTRMMPTTVCVQEYESFTVVNSINVDAAKLVLQWVRTLQQASSGTHSEFTANVNYPQI